MLNDLVVADILANGTPNLYFDARVSTADQIVQYVTYPPMNWRACRHVWGLASTQKVARRVAG